MSDTQVVTRPEVVGVPTAGDLSVQAAIAAAAAQERALVEAMYVVAQKVKRDNNQFRLDIIAACQDPTFAETAIYQRPAGRKQNPETGKWEPVNIEGWSIRAMETFNQLYGNTHVAARIPWDDADRSAIAVQVIDVQRNSSFSGEAIIEKTVERKDRKGREVVGRRINTYGDEVWIVRATSDEHRNHMGAERSKLVRDNIRRLLPGYLLEKAWAVVKDTRADQNAKDPNAARNKICDKFAALGVSALMLKEYLGRALETINANDLDNLSALYNGLKENQFTWAEAMRVQNEPAEGDQPKGAAAQKLRDKVASTKPAAPEGSEK